MLANCISHLNLFAHYYIGLMRKTKYSIYLFYDEKQKKIDELKAFYRFIYFCATSSVLHGSVSVARTIDLLLLLLSA